MKNKMRDWVRNWLIANPRLNPFKLSNLGLGRVISSSLRIDPNFIIIGSEKCGTTSLYNYLIKHPAVMSSNTKEVHYFDINYEGLWWYKAHFPTIFEKIFLRIFNKKIVCGEATPYYMYHPLVASRIIQDLPDVKLIVILRDPVDRAYSQYNDNKRKNQETLSFEDAIREEKERIKGEKEKMIQNPKYNSLRYWAFSYLSKGIYIEQLKKWFDIFPKNQFLILDTFKLQSEPQKVLDEIFNYLGVSSHKIKINEKKNVGNYDQIAPETRKYLQNYFSSYNRDLENFLERKFSWSY